MLYTIHVDMICDRKRKITYRCKCVIVFKLYFSSDFHYFLRKACVVLSPFAKHALFYRLSQNMRCSIAFRKSCVVPSTKSLKADYDINLF